MIARLSGNLAELTADSAVIDVGGVGYLVHLSGKTLGALGPVGGEVLILTELQVREDAWTLFGFGSAAERDAFRALTSIQGVGGRLALAILSALSPDELARAVGQGDKADRIASARRPPTPWMLVRARKESRSAAEPKPNKVHASSRTWSSVRTSTSPPIGPRAARVLPLK